MDTAQEFVISRARQEDMNELLILYTQLHDNTIPDQDERVTGIMKHILTDPYYHLLMGRADGLLVASVCMVIISNLTHNQRPYALIENVITDEAYRGRGYATALLAVAKEIAVSKNCYKIMLMTGSKSENTLSFYERAGYNRQDKTAFIMWLKDVNSIQK